MTDYNGVNCVVDGIVKISSNKTVKSLKLVCIKYLETRKQNMRRATSEDREKHDDVTERLFEVM